MKKNDISIRLTREYEKKVGHQGHKEKKKVKIECESRGLQFAQ